MSQPIHSLKSILSFNPAVLDEFQKVVDFLKVRFRDYTKLEQGQDSSLRFWVRLYKSDGYHFRVEVPALLLQSTGATRVIKQLKTWQPEPGKESAFQVRPDGLHPVPWTR